MEERPTPDNLLHAVAKQERQEKRGKLRVFFGMSAGVGKTYAMLRAAQQRRKEGVDIVIGVVETHGRSETAALLEGLTLIPKKRITYRDTEIAEMDLDAILVRRPALVLVDELAHTNAPESRHPKRWHDVVELLDAGIDVYTTINVQHLESRKETVEEIAGITIRETVPDSLLEQANQIELIDITPMELLARLREGKVYLGPQSMMAEKHFFQEDRLTALREIALRFTTEKIDQELGDIRSIKPETQLWKPIERLLVAISHSPYSEQVIRAAKNRAFELDAPWIALYINTGLRLSEQDQKQLARNLALAKDLGAELVTVTDTHLTDTIRRIARQKAATQIVLGRPTRRRFRDALSGGTLLEQLVREEKELDVHVIRQEPAQERSSTFSPNAPRFEASFVAYWQAFWMVLIIAVISSLVNELIGYKAVGFIFLLGVLAISLLSSLGPILFASSLAALVWDFFFIPPFGTFLITSPEDIGMCITFFLTAIVTGILAHRIRKREGFLRIQTERLELLLQLVQEVAEKRTKATYLPLISKRLGSLLKGTVVFLVPSPKGELENLGAVDERFIEEKELAVAKWVLAYGRSAGSGTDTLAGANGLYLPMRSPGKVVGVMAFIPASKVRTSSAVSSEELQLLLSIADQLAVSIERETFEAVAEESRRVQLSEQLHQATLNSLSHELRTPLTTIVGTASALTHTTTFANEKLRSQLLTDLVQSTERLNQLVENLLDMSRIQAGRMELKMDWHDIGEIVAFACDALAREFSNHPVTRTLPEKLPLVRVDFHLLEQALLNVMRNAAMYSPPDSPIEIAAAVSNGVLDLSVSDTGPGIPEDQRAKVFEKFFRLPGTPPGGTGLGLSIAKGLVEAHGGNIKILGRQPHGSVFHLLLPVHEPPSVEKSSPS